MVGNHRKFFAAQCTKKEHEFVHYVYSLVHFHKFMPYYLFNFTYKNYPGSLALNQG